MRQSAGLHQPGNAVQNLTRADHQRIVFIGAQKIGARRLPDGRLLRVNRRRCAVLRQRQRDGEDRDCGDSKEHAYFYSTIPSGGEFLPKSEIDITTGTGTDEQVEPGWRIAVRAAQDKQATDIKILELTGVTSFTDYFVICTGANTRQTQAIIDEVGLQLKKRGELPNAVEGYDTGEWVLSDYGDFLVHAFTTKSREYYSLDRLWREAKEIPVPAE